jgi:5'-nucleotidase
VQRKAQARVVRAYVDGLLAANPDAWLIVAGDLNDFQFPEPGEGEDDPLSILADGDIPLTNLIEHEHPAERFTFVFDGNSQVLDHILVSPALLAALAGQDVLNFNAGFPEALSANPATPLRAADHNAVEARFKLKKAQARFTLTVLHNNDGESQLINAPGQVDFGGIARFKTLADTLKAAALTGSGKRGVVMLSSGDNFLAGPQFNASLSAGVPYYDSVALRMVGYDAMAIGNHEFDFGPDVLADFIAGFEGDTRFVSANLDFSAEPSLQTLVDSGIIVKSHVIELGRGECVAIVGATTPLLPAISSPRNVVVDPAVAAALQVEIDHLTANGYDKIVVISHLQNVNEDLALAPMLQDVDVMIAGGGDELLANEGDLLVPGDVRNPNLPYPLYATGADGSVIPIITTPGDYKYVGRLIVNFDKDGRVISVDATSGPVRVAGGANPDAVTPDPQVQSLVVDPVQAYIAAQAANIIATSEVALEGRRDPGVRTQETNLGNLMADALLWQANQLAAQFGVAPADVALQNGGGIRNNNLIPAGPISELNTFAIAAFANFVSIVPNVPPAQFKEIMENAVSRIPLADGRFAQIAGFTLVYDPSQPAQAVDNAGNVLTPGSRVREIRLDDGTYIVQSGAVVPGAPSVSISTNDFSARGGDQYPFRGAPFTTVGVTYQQALFNYIVDGLSGQITAADYPEGGEGRITTAP